MDTIGFDGADVIDGTYFESTYILVFLLLVIVLSYWYSGWGCVDGVFTCIGSDESGTVSGSGEEYRVVGDGGRY